MRMSSHRSATLTAVVAIAAMGAISAGPQSSGNPAATASRPHDAGPSGEGAAREVVARPFQVPETSAPLYGVRHPSEDPERQIARLVADDGVELYVETWLPAAKDGHVPPEQVPVILFPTPYHRAGEEGFPFELRELFVSHGYAFSRVHLRGTGESGGCLRLLDLRDAEDVALAIEYVGRDAEWSNGRVGLSGMSAHGGAVLNALLRGDAQRTRYVGAVEVAAPGVSIYESVKSLDGVPQILGSQTLALNIGAGAVADAVVADPAHPEGADPLRPSLSDRAACLPDHALPAVEHLDGSRSSYFEERDMRPEVAGLDVPLLMFHGHLDYLPHGVLPIIQAGFFDLLPDGLPHVGIFGLWEHEYPVEAGAPFSDIRLEVRRADSDRMRLAWFDHFLRGIDADVEDWPQVQVQTTDGLWRVLDRWPTPEGSPGRLALGPDGRLGAATPSGSSSYVEAGMELRAGTAPGTHVVFTTPALADRLELSGIAVADLWVVLEQSDAHIVVRLEALDADGEPIDAAWTYGSRSAQHLEPIVDGRFIQSEPVPAPTGEPVRVQVRLNPTGLAIPVGGRLRMTVSGTANTTEGIRRWTGADPIVGNGTQPSGVVQTVTILHDCTHPSALRFTMPDSDRFLTPLRLDASDPTRTVPPRPQRFDRPAVDGGGLATIPACEDGPGSTN